MTPIRTLNPMRSDGRETDMRVGSLYFASDKAIFDALTPRCLMSAEPWNVFLSRGIVISTEVDEKLLASQFSALFHGYYDYRKVSLLLGAMTVARKPPTSSLRQRSPKTS